MIGSRTVIASGEEECLGWKGKRELSRVTETFCLDLCVSYMGVFVFQTRQAVHLRSFLLQVNCTSILKPFFFLKD